MKWFRNLSIRAKLTTLIMGVVAVVYLLSMLAVAAFLVRANRQALVDRADVLADIIVDNSRGALLSQDQDDLHRVLDSLRHQPMVVYAMIDDSSETTIAEYGASSEEPVVEVPDGADRPFFDARYLHVFKPIRDNDQLLGTLYLRCDTSARRIGADLGLTLVIVALFSVGGVALTYSMLGWILAAHPRLPQRTEEGQQGDHGDATSARTRELESRAKELARLNSQLEHERYLLQTLMDNIPDSIYFKDLQSRFVRINAGMATRFDLKDVNDALGKTDFDLFAEEHARPAFDDEQRIIKTGQPIIGLEEKEVWLDGRAPRWVLTTKMPLRDEQGDIIGTFGLSRDITDMKASQQRLAQQAQQLLALNEQLAQSNKDLDDFAYIASHDLKEPLRGISGYAHLLREDYGDKLGPDAHRQLQTLEHLCKRMENLIDALLEFSRVGRADLAVGTTDLNCVVNDVVEMMGPTIEEQNVQLQLDPLPTIDCDAVRVRQLLHNLVSNAIKYNESEEKRIEIGCREGDGSSSDDPSSPGRVGPYVFYVRDNGIGIREKHLGSIFRIFKRLHGRDKYGGGTGAGLAFAKQIVERHGGKIWAESVVGEGTTIFFTLQQD